VFSSKRADAPDGVLTTIVLDGGYTWPDRWSWEAVVSRGGIQTHLSGKAITRRRAERKMARAIETLEVETFRTARVRD
jgi:hypothetical protein